jgi:hypothetical protein
MHIVRHGDGEKKQHKRNAERAPFLKGMPVCAVSLMDPAGAPGSKKAHGDEHPEDIEKQFHGYPRCSK